MRQKSFLRFALLIAASFASVLTFAYFSRVDVALAAPQEEATPGSLQATNASGKPVGLCPLKHTDVKAEISGFLSRVRVTQEFENPFKEKIEAVYTFPLPQNAAVDDMTMVVGDRTVRGRILPREEARNVYEAARAGGQVASLLDQERPNIFTQAVANIMPGEKVTVTISYVETLKYEDGAYEFVFPMVVAPRYIPGKPTSAGNRGTSPNTTQVPDASKITPPLTPKGTRAGHDISVEVALDAGVPIDALLSKSHEIDVERPNGWSARVSLKNKTEIPNKDFVLKYDVAGGRVEDAVLTHRTDKGGFFTLILQPPDRISLEDLTPKEIVFVLDTSGSMGGFPIEKAKEAMKLALDGLHPQDTFNLITFAGDTHILFPQPVPATKENMQKAQTFLASRAGNGGTEMMTAIKAALEPSDNQGHIRVVCFMTDGEVGNDLEIISEVQKHKDARVFAFGIGSSVNRFLLDKMAEEGRGEVEYVSLSDDGSAAARRFHERVRSPLLTDISIEWAGLPVADVYPKRIPDLFSAKPVILSGRYTSGGRARVLLKGKMSGRDFVREIPVELPESEARHDVLQTLWARTRIDDLMRQDYAGVQRGNAHADLKETITQLGIEYRLMTQFTSFVAVEEMVVTEGGQPRQIEVPVELPEGTSREGLEVDDELSIRIGNYASFSLGRRNAPAMLPNQPPTVALSATLSNPSPTPMPTNAKVAKSTGTGNAGRVGFTKGRARNMGGGDSQPGGGGAGGATGNNGQDYANRTFKPKGVGTSNSTPVVSSGVLNGQAAVLPKPAYPSTARAARASGQVSVRVTINERGNVISATAVGGHPLLQAAAVAAARQSKFTPTKLSGKPVKVTGAIVYNFDSSGTTPTSSAVVIGEKNTARLLEEQKRRELETKLHTSLLALVDRLKDKSAQPGADEAKFVREGKAEIQVWLTDKSEAVIEQLKQLGFEIMLDPKTAQMVIGRISIEKLAALAELNIVRYIAPVKSK
jgi:Ca-activated chloride channel family protein